MRGTPIHPRRYPRGSSSGPPAVRDTVTSLSRAALAGKLVKEVPSVTVADGYPPNSSDLGAQTPPMDCIQPSTHSSWPRSTRGDSTIGEDPSQALKK